MTKGGWVGGCVDAPQCRLILYMQGWDIRRALGCVIPASRLPLAAGREFMQPRAHLIAQLYIVAQPFNHEVLLYRNHQNIDRRCQCIPPLRASCHARRVSRNLSTYILTDTVCMYVTTDVRDTKLFFLGSSRAVLSAHQQM